MNNKDIVKRFNNDDWFTHLYVCSYVALPRLLATTNVFTVGFNLKLHWFISNLLFPGSLVGSRNVCKEVVPRTHSLSGNSENKRSLHCSTPR